MNNEATIEISGLSRRDRANLLEHLPKDMVEFKAPPLKPGELGDPTMMVAVIALAGVSITGVLAWLSTQGVNVKTPAPRRTIVPATAPAARSVSSSVSSKTTNGGNKCNTMQGRCAVYAGGSCTPSTGHWRYSCYGERCTLRYNECISRALAGRSP